MVIVPHPPYSLDLAPYDFTLFLKLKMKLKGQRFETASDIWRESQAVLNSINGRGFHIAFWVWTELWDFNICSQGDYLKEIATKTEQVKPAFLFFHLVLELSFKPDIS
jgi:hypothetical protein